MINMYLINKGKQHTTHINIFLASAKIERPLQPLLTFPGLVTGSNSPALLDALMQPLPTSPQTPGLPRDTEPVMGSILFRMFRTMK